MSSFVLAVDATNPGEYLAVCGLIELVSRLDKSATSAWSRRTGLVREVPNGNVRRMRDSDSSHRAGVRPRAFNRARFTERLECRDKQG